MSRISFAKMIAPVCVVAAVAAAPVSAEPNMEKYNKSCAMCHEMGAAGAPKVHDVKAWEPRMAKGLEALVASVKNGLNAMPPTGLCADCTDAEYEELIKYMAEPK